MFYKKSKQTKAESYVYKIHSILQLKHVAATEDLKFNCQMW